MIARSVIRLRLGGIRRRCGDVMNLRRIVGMGVDVPFRMGWIRVFMDVDRPPTLLVLGEAGRGARAVAEREGGARSEDAKQIG